MKLIPNLLADSNSNFSLVKVSSATIVQDCLEDEFFQPFIRVKEDISIVNTGLWTRSIYDPLGRVDLNSGYEPDLNNLQVRKRMLASCTKTGKSFIVALYRKDKNETDEEWENWRQETFKMNSVHNFIGILEVDEIEESMEDNSHLPTLHLIKRTDHLIENLVEIKEENVEETRLKLVNYLETCFNNNKAAAEALMLSLVSRPSMRVEGLVESLFIGKLTLNLCINKIVESADASEELKRILKKIKPFISGPVKINSEGSFSLESIYPQLDVQSGQLRPGAALQQPDGSVLIVDETLLNEGEFNDQGVCNLQALIDLIRHQHVNYDFGMQQITLKTDMPVILVSLAKKSVLPFDLKVDCESFRCVDDVDEADLNLFRSYLHHCRALTCEVDEEMAEYLEKEYLNLRKSSPLLENGNPKMNEQEFHRLINLARLLAISRGRTELSKEIWVECVGLYN